MACRHVALLCCCLLAVAAPARAGEETLCQDATAAAEHATGVPDQLLGAISRVETGRYQPAVGSVRAWPWTINAQGVGHYYDSRAEAIAAARAFQAAGIRSIDVGCMQINLMYHPDGFASLDQAFDPGANALYAARFLQELFHQTGSWPHAAAAYHSQTPDLGVDYQRKVLEAWAEPVDRPSTSPRHTAPQPATAVASAAAPASVAVAAVSRPLGGFGRIIRSADPSPAAMAPGGTFGSLAAYRARPVALASFPIHPSSPPS